VRPQNYILSHILYFAAIETAAAKTGRWHNIALQDSWEEMVTH
jgi:hypothetical protein